VRWIYGSDSTRCRGQGRRAGSSQAAGGPPAQRRNESYSQPLDGLVRERPQVASALFQPVQQIDASHGLARHERLEERLYRLLLDQAEHLAHPVRRQGPRVRRQELI
jgi:hypothetical protein